MSRRLVVGAPATAPEPTDDAIASLIASGAHFWLDLHGQDEDDMGLLADVVHLHPLALEDARAFGERPKIEDYDGTSYIVAFGAAPAPDRDRLVEVHIVYAEGYMISLHRDPSPAIDGLLARPLDPPRGMAPKPYLLYRLLDELADSFLPAMDEVEDDIEGIEAAIGEAGGDRVQERIYAARRRLLRFRRVVMPQRDQAARIAGGSVDLPGVDEDARRYFRDVEDRLIHVAEAIDGSRDLLQGANDMYLSAVSTRLNVVTKQLTVIAGIFLPLSFITGFFGQNFGWLVRNIGGAAAFFALGLGLQVATLVALVLVFRRRGWL